MPRVAIKPANGNHIVIDDTYLNMCLATKGTVTTSEQVSGSRPQVTISYAAPSGMAGVPVLALSNNGVQTVVAGGSQSGNVYQWVVYTQSAAVLTYYVFMTSDMLAGTGSLVLRRNTDGKVTFDSDANYLKVMATLAYQGTEAQQVALPSGPETFAIAQLSASFVRFDRLAPAPPNTIPPTAPYWRVEHADYMHHWFESGLLRTGLYPVRDRLYQGAQGGDVQYNGYSNFLMAIDVTGL